MTLLDFLRLTRANLKYLIIFTVAGALLGLGVAALQPKVYSATSSGYVTAGGGSAVGDILSGDSAAQAKASAYLPLVTSGPVAKKIAENNSVGIDESAIPSHLSASVEPNSTLIKVTATASSPQDAATLANNALQATADYVSDLEGRESAVKVTPLDDAQAPDGPVSPSYRNYLLIGAAVGLVLAYLIAFLRKFADVRVRTTDDLENATEAGTLGILPKSSALDENTFLSDRADHQSEEALRQLRTNLRFVSVDAPPRSIIVSSPNPGEGKSTVSASLAHAFAKAGQPTILIDADLRRPTQAKIFGLDDAVGLSQVLSGQVGPEEAIQQIGDTELYVLPAGRIPPNPSELLGSSKMQRLIQEMSQEYLVIIDVPPLLPVTDGSLLSANVDGAILVNVCGRTRKDQAQAAAQALGRVNGHLLGTVMNMTPEKGLGSHYYGFGYGGYRSGYQAYYGQDGEGSGSGSSPAAGGKHGAKGRGRRARTSHSS